MISAVGVFSNQYDPHYTMLFNHFNRFSICSLTLPLHIYGINNHYCIFSCWIPPWAWLRKAETCRGITTCLLLYLIIVQWLEYVWWLDTGIFPSGQSAVGSHSFGWTGTKRKKKMKRRSILEAKGKLGVLFCTMLPYFRKSFGFWKVPRLRPFVFLVRETCRWRGVWRGVHGETRFI